MLVLHILQWALTIAVFLNGAFLVIRLTLRATQPKFTYSIEQPALIQIVIMLALLLTNYFACA